MASDFDRALSRVLVYEGGRSDNPHDPGGRTNAGVTQRTYDAYRRSKGLPLQDVYLITSEERADIYRTLYWDVIKGDKLPSGLNFAVFDGAVNSGNGRSGEWLQAALGDFYKGQIDGQIGDKTLQAVEDYVAAEPGGVNDLIEEYCSRRLGTLKRLSAWKYFGVGWSARIANVQKTAVSWHDANTVAPVDVTTVGGHNKAVVNDTTIKAPPVQQITAHLATAGGSAATAATSAGQQLTPLADTFAWLKYVCAGLTILAVVAGIVVKIINDSNADAQKSQAKALVDPDADAGLLSVAVAA